MGRLLVFSMIRTLYSEEVECNGLSICCYRSLRMFCTFQKASRTRHRYVDSNETQSLKK